MTPPSNTNTHALSHLESVLNAKREEMHGPDWRTMDWYGRPLEKSTPKPYSPMLQGLARRIVGGGA